MSHSLQGVINNGLGEYLSKLGMKQLRLAETEKYAHVNFFLKGGIDHLALEKTGFWRHRLKSELIIYSRK